MIDINKVVNEYHLKPISYLYKNKALILNTNKDKIVVKERKNYNKKKIEEYLLSRGFSFFLCPKKIIDNYEIYDYLEEIETIKEEKAIHLINVLIELQTRTTTYKEYTLDEIKEIYEEKNNLIESTISYYNQLEELFGTKIYPSPYELLLLENTSKINNTLEYSKRLIEEWYQEVTKNRQKRIVLVHNHLSLEHFIDSKIPRIINFDYVKYDSPIYDFKNFYQNHYYELDMLSLFKLYQHKYKYTKEELLLFFIEIIIPYQISFTNNTLQNTLLVNKLVSYLDITRNFILKQQQENQEKNKEKLSQK